MIRIVAFLAILAAAAFGVSWLLDHPGQVSVLWLGERIEMSVFVALGLGLLVCLAFAILWSLFAFVFRVPGLLSFARHSRKHARGREAVSRGMIAAGAGDLGAARRASSEASRRLPDDPLGLLLRAQVAQMEGNRSAAESAFAAMSAQESTRLLGLRGLHVEAHRRSDFDAAYRWAREAHTVAPLPWAGDAIVTHHAHRGEWDDALALVDATGRTRTDRATTARQRAVLETALAQDKEFVDPDGALKLARSAVRHAPNLVPAVALAARLQSRRGDFRAASKMIERAWDDAPHPELAAAYLNVRPGDSNSDRFARATALARRMPDHPESRMLVAEAALARRDFARAREAMTPLVKDGARPTTRMCLTMANIEETENGETGLLREWLARASRAPRDPAWVADGVISARWAPASPVTGKLDAYRWETPREDGGIAPREPITAPISVELPAPAPRRVEPPKAEPVLPAPVTEPPVALPVAQPMSAPPPPAPLPPTPLQLVPSPPVPSSPVPSSPVPSSADLDVTSEAQSDTPTPQPAVEVSGPVTDKAPADRPRGNGAASPPVSSGSPKPIIFPLATSPDDPGPRPLGAPYSGGFHS